MREGLSIDLNHPWTKWGCVFKRDVENESLTHGGLIVSGERNIVPQTQQLLDFTSRTHLEKFISASFNRGNQLLMANKMSFLRLLLIILSSALELPNVNWMKNREGEERTLL